jgi:hypothetical protein
MGRFRIAEVELAKKPPVPKLIDPAVSWVSSSCLVPRRSIDVSAETRAIESLWESSLALRETLPMPASTPPLNVSPELGTREPLLLPVM